MAPACGPYRIFPKPRNPAPLRRECGVMGDTHHPLSLWTNHYDQIAYAPLTMAMCIALTPAAVAQTMAPPQGSSMSKPDTMGKTDAMKKDEKTDAMKKDGMAK